MAKSRKRKDHNKKLASRNAKLQDDKKKYEKFQKEMLMKMIENEKSKGMFDNNPQMSPILNGPIIEGPTI